jgi:hypothetical protein
MNRPEHLLTCLAEECAEVAQRVSKALRFGLHEVQAGQALTNAQRIVEEMRDLNAVSTLLQAEGILEGPCMPSADQALAKLRKIERFMDISRREGVLS